MECDVSFGASTAWKIHKASPGSRFEVFEESGHLPYYEKPERFRGVVEAFLAANRE